MTTPEYQPHSVIHNAELGVSVTVLTESVAAWQAQGWTLVSSEVPPEVFPALDGQVAALLTSPTTATYAALGAVTGNGQLSERAVTGNYTLASGDAQNMILHCTAASALTITVPSDTSASLPVEVAIPWRQWGAGQISFVAGSGATLVSRQSLFKSAGQYAGGTITKVVANTWLLEGDISA